MKNRVARLLSLGIALAAVSVVHAQDKGMNTNMSFPSRGLEPGASDLNPSRTAPIFRREPIYLRSVTPAPKP